jgi:hypothetical protein
MTEFEGRVLADLEVLKSQMDQLMGVGQPGRLHHLERRVAANEHGVQRMRGFVGAFGMVLTVLHLAISYLSGRHN